MKRQFQTFGKNIPLIISGGAFVMLFATSMTRLLTAAVIIAVLFIASFFLKNVFAFWKSNLSLLSVVLTLLLLVALTYMFYSTMIFNSKIQAIGAYIGVNSKLTALLLSAAGGVFGFYFLNLVLEFILFNLSSPDVEARSESGNFNPRPAGGGRDLHNNRKCAPH